MKWISSIIFFLFYAQFSFTQKSTHAIQLSANTLNWSSDFIPLGFEAAEPQTFTGPALGISWWDEKDRYGMIELSGFEYTEDRGGFTNEYLLVNLRYEKGTILPIKNKKSNFRFRLGISPKLGYAKLNVTPGWSPVTPREEHRVFINISGVLHMEYWAGDNVFFNITPSLTAWAFGVEFIEREIPNVSSSMRKSEGFFTDYGGTLLRLGAGLKF